MKKNKHKECPLIVLIANKKEAEALAHLSQNPESAYQRDDNDTLPIQAAIVHQQRTIYSELLNHSEQFSIPDKWGNTVIWTAFFNANLISGDAWFLQQLLPIFNELHHKNNAGRSVWDFACKVENITLFSMIQPYARMRR